MPILTTNQEKDFFFMAICKRHMVAFASTHSNFEKITLEEMYNYFQANLLEDHGDGTLTKLKKEREDNTEKPFSSGCVHSCNQQHRGCGHGNKYLKSYWRRSCYQRQDRNHYSYGNRHYCGQSSQDNHHQGSLGHDYSHHDDHGRDDCRCGDC